MSSALFPRSRLFWVGSLAVLAGLAVWAGVERKPLLAWYYAGRLAGASDDECAAYVDRLEPLGIEALPPLMRHLRTGNERAQVNCGWAVAELARRWGLGAAETVQLSHALAGHFSELDPVGQREALSVWRALLPGVQANAAPDWLLEHLASVLDASARRDAGGARPAALGLAAEVMHQFQPNSAQLLNAAGQLVPAGLKDGRAECRVDAIRLAAAPGISQLDRVAALLANPPGEPEPQVRATAILALSRQEDLFATDELLCFLHDVDPEVRTVAEQTLKGRGLSAAHLELARQMTDPQPQIRARVPGLVFEFSDLDARLWLQRLSRDTSPAVRAATVRAAGEAREWQLADRLREMARGDPSPTVRQIARFYLQQQLIEAPPGREP